MNKHTNFEDSIYIVLIRIRMIQDLLVLDADPDMFLNKTLDDIDFIENSLKILLAALMENRRLIGREELLNHLSELEWQFSRLLSEILNGEKSLSVQEFPALKEKFSIQRIHSLERRKIVENSGSGDRVSEEPLVSSHELSELLKGL